MKMIGTKYKNLGRLKDALVSNAFKMNLPIEGKIAKPFRDYLMDFAMKNLSKDVVEFLLTENAICNFIDCVDYCPYNKMAEVYNYINEMVDKHGSFTKNTVPFHKRTIIKRLLSPEKILVNNDRLLYAMDLIKSGFISLEEFKKIANDLCITDKHKAHFTMISRELLLIELGL